jgi:hypothetical protein
VRVQFEPVRDPAHALGRDQRGPRAHERVDHNVAARGDIEDRVGH